MATDKGSRFVFELTPRIHCSTNRYYNRREESMATETGSLFFEELTLLVLYYANR
jgi:hypothetical protein